MHEDAIVTWIRSSYLANSSYVEDLYESYLIDPSSVPLEWRECFSELGAPQSNEQPHAPVRQRLRQEVTQPRRAVSVAGNAALDQKQFHVLQLINAYRYAGHQYANLDPLGLTTNPVIPELELSYYQLDTADLDREFHIGSFLANQERMTLRDLLASLRNTYCDVIGAEFMHMTSQLEKRWIQERLESVDARPKWTAEAKKQALEELTAAEGLERYLGAKFPGAKRFSLEGGDMLIPMVKSIIRQVGATGHKEIVIGMAHRGRLTMLVNVLGKRPKELFDQFAGHHGDAWGTGDVKYHMGFSSDFATEGGNVHLALAFNPSHLEIVNPVVIGSVRARMERLHDNEFNKVLPITIHGDSAIAGQGVVAETFNMSQTRGFGVGGTVRIVINNQIGFTTSNSKDTRSTRYCTDIAKMVQAPIFHVNADHPEAVLWVTKLAIDFRNTFHRDVVIDLVCYRRNGHNEADEPTATQPLMYQKIRQHPTTRQLYAEQLVKEGIIDENTGNQMVTDYRQALDRGECVVKEWRPMSAMHQNWTPFLGHDWQESYDSTYPLDKLSDLAAKLCRCPDTHVLQSRVQKVYEDRLLMCKSEKMADWGFAENLAYATLLMNGNPVRLTGQDSGRGTFFHRHAVLHNQTDGSTYTPLMNIDPAQAPFRVYDSVLSEEAVLAFEYGYATATPDGLTLWEAQFGDFANGAQVVIDQFLSSGEQKWGRLCGLVLLLPHGYEGQGAEHSSGRPERYLQMCAQHNMQVCMPTTPAQIYHLLRRQMLRPMRRPLVVFTPKSLLRHPLAVSSLEELAEGRFQNAIAEVDNIPPEGVQRVVLCSGKVYYDLLEARRKSDNKAVAIIRIEQLYPFPEEELREILRPYEHVQDFVWCQEEPKNQGAWYNCQHRMRRVIPSSVYLNYVGRPASAAPAVGYMSLHLQQQKTLVEEALTIK
nr:2-oxoglutarate dehydrogenase E1 component [uncultured Tolumonas sp.]